MKIKENYTIDKEASDWIRKNHNNASEFVNSLIIDYIKNHDNPFIELQKIRNEKKEILEKETIKFKQIETILEEGDKTEREKAKKFLEQEKEREERKRKECQELTKILEKNNLLNELMLCEDIKDLYKFNKKLFEQNIKISEAEKFAGFGINLLSEVAFFNGKNIPLSEIKQQEVKNG